MDGHRGRPFRPMVAQVRVFHGPITGWEEDTGRWSSAQRGFFLIIFAFARMALFVLGSAAGVHSSWCDTPEYTTMLLLVVMLSMFSVADDIDTP